MTVSSRQVLETLWEDEEFILSRYVWDDEPFPVLGAAPSSAQPSPETLARLQHAYAFREEFDLAWAARPLKLEPHGGRLTLLSSDPGGEPLARRLGRPWQIPSFLRVAIGLASALGRLHERDLIHKDIKPASILVKAETGEVWLTGFYIVSRLPRERKAPTPSEITGTLAYMAPEQTGRINRSVDSRSDLYALGVTFYQMLTGSLPFAAADPMEWIHCHIARQPAPPAERVAGVPSPLSAMVMKLLAKSAEERYQSARGVEADLRQCLAEWEAHGRIEPFPLGAADVSDRLLTPDKLYGRGREIDGLLSAFDRVVASEGRELVLVSGYSGIGKSSVVNELHKAVTPARGLFASGKFDQYKRDIPYATLAQAFQVLIRDILGKGEVELDQWRGVLRTALGANGDLIVNLVPELELVIGKQPPVPHLPPQEAKNRFQMVFRRFLSVFARKEHPLALFLDDLQWLDAATLDFLEDLVAHSEVRHLLLIGAYRDNEVGPAHPLMRTLDAIRGAGVSMHEIVLAPLGLDDVSRLVSDALHCEQQDGRPVAQLVYEKTEGNPLFAIQFFTALAEEGLLAFDRGARVWRWDIGRIRTKSYTDNVVDLMVGKLMRLPPATQDTLKQLACLGTVADVAVLALIHGKPEEAMHEALWEAVRAGLIVHQDNTCKFLHDRIQQAAYSLIAEEHRPKFHRRIGRTLLKRMTADQLAEHLFDVANQFNRGAGGLLDGDERVQVARINLRAGRKAKASAAFASARQFFSAGMALFDEEDWGSQYELMFHLRLERAECELLTGDFETAEQLIAELLQRGASKVDQAVVSRLNVELRVMKSETLQAIDSALACLRLFGIDIPAHPTPAELKAEYETLWRILDGRPIETLIDLPTMTDSELQTAMQLLSVLLPPAYFTDSDLWCLLACRMVSVSVQHGTTGAGAQACASLAAILGPVFRRYRDGYRFAELACVLADKHGFLAYQAKIRFAAGGAAFWTQPITTMIDFFRAAFRTAIEIGDLTYACYSMDHLVTSFLLRNDPLDAAWRESEINLNFVRKARYHDVAAVIVSQQRFIATMQGRTAALSTFSDAQFDEQAFEAEIRRDRTPTMVCLYWILKLQARFLSGDYDEALASADKARALLWAVPFHIQRPDYFCYAALTVAAVFDKGSADDQTAWRDLLMAHRKQLCEWADNYPPTFGHKHALVAAEIARLEGRDADAMRLYEQAIQSAREHSFVQNEALAHEVAARFYAARGFERFALVSLRDARRCYLEWGAHGKVRQLDRLYPQIVALEQRFRSTTTSSPVQELDLASVVKASQAVSSEIELPKLIERLMAIALENAGADRGLLILPTEEDYLIQAEARAAAGPVDVVLREAPITAAACPESLVRYAIRTHESVILHDASKQSPFSEDAYLRREQAKSILCIPLIKQGRLIGLLYLENALTAHAFPPERIAILELLAAQAAISLENSGLYHDLSDREATIRRLVDANIIGIFTFEIAGEDVSFLEVNDAFLRMIGYEREDFVSRRMRRSELTPVEWRDRDKRTLVELRESGVASPFEKEYFRRDSSRVPVWMGSACLDETRTRGVAFVLDLTESKRANEALRQMQMQLAHSNRLETLGQLAATIAHEVSQPIAATLSNAQAGLRWLCRDSPDLDEVQQVLDRIVKDISRAGAIVQRIRGLSKRTTQQQDSIELSEAVREVVDLVRSQATKNGVSLRARLADHSPLIRGDRVELQQVFLNLMLNAIEAMSGDTEGPRELLIAMDTIGSGEVLVTVSDTGPGLASSAEENLFKAFYTTKPNGLGLGLSICRSIVEAHGGQLWASANSPRGAALSFTLPVYKD